WLIRCLSVLSVITVSLWLVLRTTRYHDVTCVALVSFSVDLVLKSFKSTLRWALKALERFGTEAVSLLAERTLLLVLGVSVLAAGQGVRGFVLVFLGVRLLDTSALSAYVQRKVLPLRPRYDPALWWELLRTGLPFAV